MSKEKNTKTQSRKKQVTDVSDALFHVTPQPSIDIFEVLGGAINVQTAAFLTGKVDYLGQNQMPAHHQQNSTPLQNEKLIEAKDLKLIQKGQNKGKNAPNEQEVANEISHSSSVNLDTLEPEKVPAKPTPESNTIHELEAVQDHRTIIDNQEKPSIPDSHYAYEHDINDAKNPAIHNDSAHSTAISTACHDQKNSMLNSKSDIQPDSHQNSTGRSTETIKQNSIEIPHVYSMQNSIENNTHEEQTYSLYHTKTSTPKNTKEQHTDHTYAPQKSTKNAVNNPQNSTIQGPHLLTQLTKREEELLQFLRHHHGQIVSYSQILKALNWRESQRCTARNIVARFETNGIIQRQRIQGTRSQGYLFTMCEQSQEQNPYDSIHTPPYTSRQNTNNATCSIVTSMDKNMGIHASTHSIETSMAGSYSTIMQNSTASSPPSYIDKIDRLIQSIWQSDQDTIEACWPYVAKAGLRSAHLRQLEKVFELQGFESGTVSLGLRYLDWQLEQGPLSNARGEFIEDPVAYWLSSMRRHGYYSKPKGYVDPLLEAKRLLAEEEESKLAMQARLEQVRMESEAAQEDQRCEHLFNALIEQGTNHALWSAFYQSLPQMHRQKVDAEGPVALVKKFAMLRTFIKELL